jgi:DNA-binding LacI/PurR family transcriptional regulator
VPVAAIDQFTGARRATVHLLELGHRTVWHIAGPGGWPEAADRVRGWRSALESARAPIPPLLEGDWSARSGHELGLRLVHHPDVTAIFVANDQMALGALRALHEAGRRIPQDVSVVGFDDIPEAPYFTPPLTTVRQDFDEMGRRGLRLLLDTIERPGAPPAHHEVAPELIVRASSGPLARSGI